MSNYRRPKVTGASIFFTVSLADPRSFALTTHFTLLQRAVAMTRQERPFNIDAWVVLPNHVNCIWTLPAGDRDYPTRWRLIKSRFSRELPPGPRRPSHIRRDERGIWQRRYWEHHIRDNADFSAHVQFCRDSPVRHGLVEQPRDWAFAFFRDEVTDGSFG
jgi:putative transposase